MAADSADPTDEDGPMGGRTIEKHNTQPRMPQATPGDLWVTSGGGLGACIARTWSGHSVGWRPRIL